MSEAAPISEELEALVGTTLAERYRIDGLLGVGGMGAVFRARHLLLKRDVAVKVLHPQLTANEDISKRFDREAQSAARLDHPNIIPVSEFGSTPDGMKYMVMPVLEGKELADLLVEALDPIRAIDLEVQILRGLEHAHNNGVIHRDLKPENVFVTTDHDDDEILKLVDFGIAKIVDEEDEEDASQPLTRLGLVFGTPHYMSPEQATGSTIDQRTDIYSAGVLLYQMLSGELPFDHEDPVSLIRMQVTLDPPPLPDTIPMALQRVVKMMMAKGRDQRYPDARSARKALQAVLARIADDEGVAIKLSPYDTGIVDPRDIYPPGHEALTQNPAFASSAGSGSGSGSNPGMAGPYDPSEHSDAQFASERSDPELGSDSTIPPVTASAPRTTQMSLADALTGSHPGMQQRSPATAWLDKIPRKWMYAGAGVVGLLILIAVIPSGSDDDDGESNDTLAVAKPEPPEPPEQLPPGVDEDALIAIDVALTSKNDDEALDLIRPARDKFPDDPQLMWREGKALAMQRAKSSKVTALERYAEALAKDPSLSDNPDFYGELGVLLRTKNLQQQSINLALQKLGPAGHKFLLELVNVDNSKKMLGWVDRHRAVDVLMANPETAKLVDVNLNLARDLSQANKAPKPCESFATALDQIAATKDEYFVDSLYAAEAPKPGDDTDDAALCEPIADKLILIRDMFTAMHPEAAAKHAPTKKKKKR